jgi:hypothetical protein
MKVRYVRHEPGNATRYDIYLIDLGRGDWLVAIPNFYKSFIVNSAACIQDGYVQAKMQSKPEVGIVDASEIAKVVAREIGTEWRGCTDENGRYAGPPTPEST